MILPQGSKEAAERVASTLRAQGTPCVVYRYKEGTWVVEVGREPSPPGPAVTDGYESREGDEARASFPPAVPEWEEDDPTVTPADSGRMGYRRPPAQWEDLYEPR